MKKILMSLVFTMCVMGLSLPANADLLNKSDYLKIQNIGNNLIKSNNINKRFTFNFTTIGAQGAFPILLDTSYSSDMNLHNNRIVSVYFADYERLTEDEVAGLIAHELAQGVHSYTGVLNGQLMFTKNGYFPFNGIAKANELRFDKKAVDYMVNAGYNPTAFVSALEKTTGEWRGTFWGRHNKTSKRVKIINTYIQAKYPQYL